MADRTGKRVVPLCDGCALPDVMTGTCTAFVDPEWQWRNYDPETGEGACWGRCDSAGKMIERLQAIIKYNGEHGMNTAGIAKTKRELKNWEEMAHILRRSKAVNQ
ncbi:MAG TPA: hypothetical protein GX716_06060 [Firmicutes bacterium]|nr:hypothetical protein [Candidatus Fermentithermobacillaceae bacterium]